MARQGKARQRELNIPAPALQLGILFISLLNVTVIKKIKKIIVEFYVFYLRGINPASPAHVHITHSSTQIPNSLIAPFTRTHARTNLARSKHIKKNHDSSMTLI